MSKGIREKLYAGDRLTLYRWFQVAKLQGKIKGKLPRVKAMKSQ